MISIFHVLRKSPHIYENKILNNEQQKLNDILCLKTKQNEKRKKFIVETRAVLRWFRTVEPNNGCPCNLFMFR